MTLVKNHIKAACQSMILIMLQLSSTLCRCRLSGGTGFFVPGRTALGECALLSKPALSHLDQPKQLHLDNLLSSSSRSASINKSQFTAKPKRAGGNLVMLAKSWLPELKNTGDKTLDDWFEKSGVSNTDNNCTGFGDPRLSMNFPNHIIWRMNEDAFPIQTWGFSTFSMPMLVYQGVVFF